MHSIIRNLVLVIGGAFVIADCSGTTGSDSPTGSTAATLAPVALVTVTIASPSIPVGQTTQATAVVRDSTGNTLTDRAISWQSSNSATATVAASGMVTAIKAGTVTITATSEGKSGGAPLQVTQVTVPPPATTLGCASPQAGWLWCDDFESDHTNSYFEYTNPSGSFTRLAGAGLNGSTSMHAKWIAGQIDAGSLKLAFGRNPSAYQRPIDAGTANYREIYWRVYVKSQAGWSANGNDKMSRAIVMAKDDWSEAAVGHVWGGSGSTSQNYYVLDPVRGTDASGTLLTSGYNDFAHFTFLGAVQGQSPVLGSGAGQWYCVEAHMKLNDAGQSNGVLEEWINGTLDAQSTGLNFLGSYNAYAINAIFLENYINNGAPQAQVRDYDEFVVSTQRVGCGSATAPPASATAASVTVSPSTLSVQAGKSGALTVTVRDASGTVINRPVTWTSSNTSAATLSSPSNAGTTVNGAAQGTSTVSATADGITGTSSVTVTAAAPPPPPPSSTGIPAPGAGATIIQDLRAALQQATTADQAFRIFGQVDHTPYRGARNTGGWSFSPNADGNGLHALRVDWEASNSTDQGIRVIDYLPGTKPTEMYVQWKARVGRYAFDTDGNGNADSYATFPQSNACKRALFSSTSGSRWDYTLHRSSPEIPKLENGPTNFVEYGDPNVWNFDSEVGGAPYTTTVHITASSAAGRNDGAYQLFINSTLVFDLHNLPMPAATWDRWEFPATCTVVPQAQSEYFWDFLIWRP